MKFYQFFIAVLFIVLSIPTSASEKLDHFDAYYIGANIGSLLIPVHHIGNRNLHLQIPGIADFPISDRWEMHRRTSMNTSFVSGRGVTFNKYHAGLELSLNHARERVSLMHSSQQYMNIGGALTNIKVTQRLDVKLRDWDLSLVTRQGFLITPKTMLFGKVGLSKNKVNIKLLSNAVVETPIGSFPANNQISYKKQVYPIIFGFGIEHKFHEHVSFRVDYTYIRYGTFKITGTSKHNYGMGDFTTVHDNKIKLQNAVVMAGLNYHF